MGLFKENKETACREVNVQKVPKRLQAADRERQNQKHAEARP